MSNSTNRSGAEYGATLLRVASGALFLAHGLLKVNVFTVAGTVSYFDPHSPSKSLISLS